MTGDPSATLPAEHQYWQEILPLCDARHLRLAFIIIYMTEQSPFRHATGKTNAELLPEHPEESAPFSSSLQRPTPHES